MSGLRYRPQAVAWRSGSLTDAELAAALRCDPQIVGRFMQVDDFAAECRSDHESGADRPRRRLSPRLRVGLAIAHALHRDAGLPVETAADAVSQSWQIAKSVLATLDFEPPVPPGGKSIELDGAAGVEGDPFMLFAAQMEDEIAIEAIDQHLDLIDGRRLVWRKPRTDTYRLACDLHRLRETPEQTVEWIGIVDRHGYRPRPARLAEETSFLRQGDLDGTRISINISLAARTMKRRALGFVVKDASYRALNAGNHAEMDEDTLYEPM